MTKLQLRDVLLSSSDMWCDQSDIDFWSMVGPDRIVFPSDTTEPGQEFVAKAQLAVPTRNTDSANKQKAANRRCQQRYRQKRKASADSLVVLFSVFAQGVHVGQALFCR